MRLALFVDDYLPYSTRVAAKMMHELAIELKRRGHEPIVITPLCKDSSDRITVDCIDGVTVWYFKSGSVKCSSKIKRAINETLLSFNAWLAISIKLKNNKLDGVIYYSPSIFWGPIVGFLKYKYKCKSYLILRDLFPQWAIDTGIIKDGSFVAKYFRLFEKVNYKVSDAIGLMSDKNLDLFNVLCKNKYNTHVIYNWASLEPCHTASSYSMENISFLEGKVVFFYGGNIGKAQDMSNLMRLAKKMLAYPNAHFLFVGQGDEVDLIKEYIIKWRLNNVNYLPSVEQSEFKHILSKNVDIGLFSLAKGHTAHNFPGKLLGYMVESIPILGSVNQGNDLLNVINDSDAGYVFINGEDDKLYSAAVKLLTDAQDRLYRGTMSNNLLRDKFSVAAAVDKIMEYMS
ncbi:glycosyltransferase family 4 protein [Yersinia wautersii]|uniref:glycosyltransferase family 4 protein n=1 Tax=Yersinia wautersii TaxID=1341643 RepID=UPI00041EA590|nr:glycosyltransferase family 4 protein [Yersinia wautersii]